MTTQADALARFDVLLLDAHRGARMALRDQLRELGLARLRDLADGVAALTEIRRRPPNLIVLDWSLGAMEAPHFLRALRALAHPRLRMIPVLAVTGHAEAWRIATLRDAGVTEVLARPVSPIDLAARLLAILERPRPFIRARHYLGPCRRRRIDPFFEGPERRGRLDPARSLTG
jgi:CheY-like chemotaxis protein